MAFVPGPRVIQAEMRYTYQGQQVENVLYFQKDSAVTVADMQGLGGALAASYQNEVQANMPTSLSLREIYLTDLTTQTSPTFTYTAILPLVGTDGQPAMPNNVTLCISFRSAGRGRSSRGRNYLLGITENEVDNNFVNTSCSVPWESFFLDLLGYSTPGPFTWVVFSRVLNGADRAVGLAQPVQSFTIVDTVVDTQRRRLPGRGT